MNFKNIRYKYLCFKDRQHVLKKLEVGPTPFSGNVATILGGGNVSENGLDRIIRDGVDLAINQSFQPDVEIRNIVFELPKEKNLADRTTSLTINAEEYLRHLAKMKELGSFLHYRPSFRDGVNGMFERYGHIADYYSYEQRFTEDNMAILEQLRKKNTSVTPFYRYSIFLAIWWAVAAGCKEIHLYGFELPHIFNGDGVDFGSETLKIWKGENAYTLLYKLWIDLLGAGIEIKMDGKGALGHLTRPI